jgi:NNP family nitrate/nitrite transporter-like MFS transporter
VKKIFILILFWSLWFLNFSSRTILSPLLPVIEDEFTISHALAGSLFFYLSLGYAITLLLSGPLSVRIGHKRTIGLGFGILATTLYSLRYASNYYSIATASFFIGLGCGLYLPSAIPMLTAFYRRRNWGKAIALHDTGASFSVLVIPLLTVLGLKFIQWKNLFVILCGACLTMIILYWLFIPNINHQNDGKVRFLSILGRRDFWIIAVLWVLASAANLGVYNVVPVFLVKERGIPMETANAIFGFSRVGGFIVAILAGMLADRYGAKKILYLAFVATGLSTMGMAMATPFHFLVIMLVIQATVCTAFFPVGLVAISMLSSFSERSLFTGASIAIGIIGGLGLTPLILGAVADVWSFQVGIFSVGVLTTLSCFLFRGIKKI